MLTADAGSASRALAHREKENAERAVKDPAKAGKNAEQQRLNSMQSWHRTKKTWHDMTTARTYACEQVACDGRDRRRLVAEMPHGLARTGARGRRLVAEMPHGLAS